MEGFYVPGSYSSSYVNNKTNEEGLRYYDTQSIEIGKQTQAALQELNNNYEETINSAYANYLASQQSIGNSAMGQGYKEAYLEMAKEQLQSNILSSNQSLEQAQLQVQQQGQQVQAALQQQFATDTANLDRFVTSFGAYKDYLSAFTNAEGQSYLTQEQQNLTVNDLYDVLIAAQPQGYTNEDNERALGFTEWLNSQYGPGSKGSQADRDWFNWAMFQGGYDDFKNALNKQKTQQAAEQIDTDREIAEQQRKEAERIRKIKDEALTHVEDYAKQISDKISFYDADAFTMFGGWTFATDQDKFSKNREGDLKKIYEELGVDPNLASGDLWKATKQLESWLADQGAFGNVAGTQKRKYTEFLTEIIRQRLQ